MIASHELLLFSDVITFTMTMCAWAWVFMRLLDLVNPRNPTILHKQWELWYSLWVDVITNLNSYLD